MPPRSTAGLLTASPHCRKGAHRHADLAISTRSALAGSGKTVRSRANSWIIQSMPAKLLVAPCALLLGAVVACGAQEGGLRLTIVPGVVGLRQSAAIQQIVTADGLKVAVKTTGATTSPDGTVVAQSPAANGVVNPGSTVQITVAKVGPACDGPSRRKVLMPRLIGRSYFDGVDTLAHALCLVGNRTVIQARMLPAHGSSAGTFLAQTPSAGSVLGPPTVVHIYTAQ